MSDERKIKDKEKKEKIAKLYLEFKKDLERNKSKSEELLKAVKDKQTKDISAESLKDD